MMVYIRNVIVSLFMVSICGVIIVYGVMLVLMVVGLFL